MPETKIILTLINGIGFLALVSVGYGAVQRLRISPFARSVLHGFLFSGGAFLTMMTPALTTGGSQIDARTIFVGLAAAFAGAPAGLITAGLTILIRIWLGGPSTLLGIGTILMALTAGIAWRTFWLRRRPVNSLGLLVLGLGIASQVLLLLVIPTNLTSFSAVATFVVSITASALFATLVIGSVMERENRQIARERSLTEYAYTDALTGLANRRSLEKATDRIVAMSGHKGFCALLLDIDHFKSVNDRYGHHVGDIALCLIADIIRADVRMHDLAMRFGGEEFVLLLPGTTAEEGEAVAERIRLRVEERPMILAHEKFTMTMSIGLAHHHGRNIEEAITRADSALYAAKAAGRNRVFRAAAQSAPARPSEARPVSSPAASAARLSERAT